LFGFGVIYKIADKLKCVVAHVFSLLVGAEYTGKIFLQAVFG
jgi:hypothetical protein